MIRGSRTAFSVFYFLFYKQNLSITFVVKPSPTKAERLEWSTIAKIWNPIPNVQCVLFASPPTKIKRKKRKRFHWPTGEMIHDAGQ